MTEANVASARPIRAPRPLTAIVDDQPTKVVPFPRTQPSMTYLQARVSGSNGHLTPSMVLRSRCTRPELGDRWYAEELAGVLEGSELNVWNIAQGLFGELSVKNLLEAWRGPPEPTYNPQITGAWRLHRPSLSSHIAGYVIAAELLANMDSPYAARAEELKETYSRILTSARTREKEVVRELARPA